MARAAGNIAPSRLSFAAAKSLLVEMYMYSLVLKKNKDVSVYACVDTVRLSMHPVRLFGLFSKVLSYDIKPTEDAQQDRSTHQIGKLDSMCVLSRAACGTQDNGKRTPEEDGGGESQ